MIEQMILSPPPPPRRCAASLVPQSLCGNRVRPQRLVRAAAPATASSAPSEHSPKNAASCSLTSAASAGAAAIRAQTRAALEEDGADVICLGSTTMHQAAAYLAERLPVPVGAVSSTHAPSASP